MKLMRVRVSYYDNWAATPMIICLILGPLLLAIGLNVDSPACAVIGIILLILSAILKIANGAVAKGEQSQSLNQVKYKMKDVYDGLQHQGFDPLTARLSIAKDLQKRYEKGDIDVDVYNKLFDYVMTEM